MRVFVWVMLSEGIGIPCWEQYLPQKVTQIRFFGSRDAEMCLAVYAARFGIVMDATDSRRPDAVIAFWNGTSDFVDATIAATPVERLVFLPDECGGGYSLL